MHYCNSTQYCNTETVFIYISQTGRWRQCSQLVHSFVSPSVCYKTCKHDIENERNNLMQTGTRDPLDKGIKWSVWVSEGQSSRPHEAEITFGKMSQELPDKRKPNPACTLRWTPIVPQPGAKRSRSPYVSWEIDLQHKSLTTTASQFVLTNHVLRPSIRIYKGLKSDQHIQIITTLALNWISGILRMKCYIENELKRNKIPKKLLTKESNRGPIYWQAIAIPVSQLAIRWKGCKALI